MKRTLVLAIAILAIVAAPLAASDRDNDDRVVKTRLVGYNETPLTINSSASGEFRRPSATTALRSITS